MKYLAILLSLYIFGLNLMPCEDGDRDCYTNNVTTEVSKAHDQHQDTDMCSPFCLCQCCHVHATQLESVSYTIPRRTISRLVFFHFEGVEKNFCTGLFQPPRS